MRQHNEERIRSILGAAVISRWIELPQDIQQALFEEAVLVGHRGERDESLREELARFLHEREQHMPERS